jgi:hypothetical protein
MPKEYLQNFYQNTELFVVFVHGVFVVFFSNLIRHHYFLILILTPFTFPPFSVLQCIVLPLNYSFCPFSSLSPPVFTFPSYLPLHLLLHYPSLLHTHHMLIRQLYQLYKIPAPCYPWHKHPPLQKQKYTQTCTRATKPSIRMPLPSLTSPFTCHPIFRAIFINHTNFYI